MNRSRAQGSLAGAVERSLERRRALRLTGLRGGARALVGAELVRAHGDRPALFLTASAKAGDALLDDLRATLGEPEGDRRTRAFPRHDTLPYDRFSPQPFVVAQRMDVLYRWLATPPATTSQRGDGRPPPTPIVVAPWTALALRVPSRDSVRASSVHLEVGQVIDRDALIETLVTAGYARMPLVEEPGELAVRGGIVDLFPPHLPRPVRVELFGDRVESIREFDAASQRSQQKLGHAAAAPPRELLFDRDWVMERSHSIRQLAEAQGVPPRAVDQLIDALLRGHVPPGAEALAPLLQRSQETAFDFLPADTLVVLDDPDAGRKRLEHYWREATSSFVTARESDRPVAEPHELLLTPRQFEVELDRYRPVSLERLDVVGEVPGEAQQADRYFVRTADHGELRRALISSRTHERALAPLAQKLTHRLTEGWRCTMTCPSLSSGERLRLLLAEYGVEAGIATDPRLASGWAARGRVEIRVAHLSEGFELPLERLSVITEEEIFGRRQRRPRRGRWKEGTAVEGLAQLSPGDYLVHAEHGIGHYRGLVEITLAGRENELLCIEYEGGDRLFLPVHRLNLVQRYGGADGVKPRLDRLGGETWERAKRRVRKSLRNMASELLAVHAARELTPGFAFSSRDGYFEEFEAGFPFEETPDQLAAIDEVLEDMQRPKPADRLVCGDVGYGKTEVAARAAFRAVLDGKQVAVLAPTTILCQQHEQTFRERFAGYPVTIEALSRFCTPKRARDVLEGLVSGRLDIVIATHRLLQKGVRFRDLGLLVVDEEQRFGVAHKERIKKMKKTVDVVTLTATPIPRTLQLAFSGLRDLSVIDTPPLDRLSVRTQVARFDEELIREAILREVRRGGQVFFMHNRVNTIGVLEQKLARLVPEVQILVAHGQMPERELESRMLSFQRGEGDVLLCTTIIENGLDIPRANTILINRADTLGLAQLYQLRGRVGRSHHRAYAYLLVPGPQEALNRDAQRRLEAIQDLSQLGSGFRLASMDLEIRGAGDLLGAEQSGNLKAVGYETYMEMLEETIEELRGKLHTVEIDPEIRLPVVARLPEAYVPDVSQRLVLYKRLASSRGDTEVDLIRDEILDRYGAMPSDAENLVHVIRTKILARRLGVVAVEAKKGEFVLSVADSATIDPQHLVGLLTTPGSQMRVTPDHKIYAPAPPASAGPQALFRATRELLGRLQGDLL